MDLMLTKLLRNKLIALYLFCKFCSNSLVTSMPDLVKSLTAIDLTLFQF